MKKNRNTLLFTKTDIANILNVSLKTLERTMTEDHKKMVGWKAGRQTFGEACVRMVIERFLGTNDHLQNMVLIRKYAGRE
jgi:hypothetical protein